MPFVALGSASQGDGVMPTKRPLQSDAARNASGSGALNCKMAVGRASRPASSNSDSTTARFLGQSTALAQLASITISSGSLFFSVTSWCGFRMGPARPMIIAATANIRSNNSHQGVRSELLSSSLSPKSSATPGKRRRTGAGGMARKTNHKIGSMAKASKSSGELKPIAPKVMVVAPLDQTRDKATEVPIARCRWCGGNDSASPWHGTVGEVVLCAQQVA